MPSHFPRGSGRRTHLLTKAPCSGKVLTEGCGSAWRVTGFAARTPEIPSIVSEHRGLSTGVGPPGRRVHILEAPIWRSMLQDLIGRQVAVQVEEGDGALHRAKSNLHGRVIHVTTGGEAPSPSSPSEQVEVELVNVEDPSLRGGRLVLRPRLAGSSLESVMEGHDVVVNIDLFLPHLGHFAKGIGMLLRVD